MPRFSPEVLDENSAGMQQALLEEMARREMEMYNRQSMVDPSLPGMRYDDSKTEQQNKRDRNLRGENYASMRERLFNPLHYNNPPSARETDIPPEPLRSGAHPLVQQFNEMQPGLPRYPMMVMPPEDDNPQMQQLLSFYTNEDI